MNAQPSPLPTIITHARQMVQHCMEMDHEAPDCTAAVLHWAALVETYGEAAAQEALRSIRIAHLLLSDAAFRLLTDITGVDLRG